MNTENDELNLILERTDKGTFLPINHRDSQCTLKENLEARETSKFNTSAVQWATSNGVIFIPTGTTTPILLPGYYEIGQDASIGVYFERIQVKTDGLLEFPEANTTKVVDEIKKFWESEHKFRGRGLTYKRGIILWGPAGGGKSCTLQLVSKDVIARGGIVIKFNDANLFKIGIRKLREIQSDIPVVVLMEDIDTVLNGGFNETEIVNLLDGVDRMDKIVFLATTNYPERLGARIMNRPSRFDKRYKVGYPNPESRKLYLNYLLNGDDIPGVDLDKWVEDTEGFSIAHLKELFVAFVVLGDKYEDIIDTLKSMKTEVTSWDNDSKHKMGFA